jgi:putative heme-binding domain-containing protein
LANSSEAAINYLARHKKMTGPGGAAVKPIELAEDVDAPKSERMKAVRELARLGGGKHQRGAAVFKQVCSACHMVGDLGKKFGPDLSDIAARMKKEEILTSILMPNDKIAKGYETISVLTIDGDTYAGFIIKEDDDMLSLGIANGKRIDIAQDDIEFRKQMNASSMPEGLIKQIAPIEFLDLIAYLERQKAIGAVRKDGWISLQSKTQPTLRKKGGYQEISRDAAIQLGPTMTNPDWNDNAHLFLSDLPDQSFDFVFHSAHDAVNPAVTIRLAEESQIGHIWLQNRLSEQFHQRASGLTIWTSLDGKKFERVWTAKDTPAEWSIDMPAGTRAKYVRIGIDGKGTFHLNRGAIYGK